MTERAANSSRLIVKVGGFGLAPLLALVSPFLALPVIARVSTSNEWAAFAIGQSAGVIVSTIMTFGWSLRGAVEAVDVDRLTLRTLWSEFLITTGALTVIVNLASVPVIMLAAPAGTQWLCIAVSASTSLFAFTPNWYAIATGRPSQLIWYSAVPKVAGVAIAAVAVAASSSLWWYPAIVAASSALGTFAFTCIVCRPVRVSIVSAFARFQKNSTAGFATIADATYSGGFLVVAGLVLPSDQLPALASIDRLFRFAKQGLTALTSALQSWVGVRGSDRRARQKVSIAWHAAVGVGGLVACGGLGGPATELLFGPDLRADTWPCVWFGFAFLLTSVSSAVAKHILMVENADRAVLESCLIGVVVAAVLIFGSGLATTTAAAAAYCATEGAVLIYRIFQTRRVARAWRIE